VTELDLGGEQRGDSTNGPCDNWLGDLAGLDGLDDSVLLNTTDLSEHQEDLAVIILLVTEHVVNKGGTWVPVTTNGDTLAYTVGVLADDVVELVGHTTRLGDVTDGTLAVELGSDNVVHHTTSVTDFESTWLDTTDSGWANNGDALLLGDMENLTSALRIVSLLEFAAHGLRLTLSGTPSAMMAMVLTCGYSINSIVEE